MPTTISTNVRAAISWSATKTATYGDTEISSSLSFSDALSNGTAADQADLIYLSSPTIAASGNLQLDLAGSLLNVFGDAVVFARVKAVYINFQTTNTASGITVGGGTDGTGTNAFVGWFGAAAHQESVDKTGCFFKFRSDATGWVVTASTADIFRIENDDGSNSALINVAIIGASA